MQRKRIIRLLLAGIATATFVATAASQPAQALSQLRNANSGLCVAPGPDVFALPLGNGTLMTQWFCNAGEIDDPNPQLWGLDFHSAGTVRGRSGAYNRYRFQNFATAACIDNADGSLTTNRLQQWSCNDSTSMLWAKGRTFNGYSEWINARSGLCMDVAGGSTLSGQVVQQYRCTSTTSSPNWAQLFSGF